MDSKYRTQRGIVTVSGNNDEYWLDAIKERLQKKSTKGVSLYDKIRNIVENKPTITVAEKVKEMQERAGVTDKRKMKTASEHNPMLFKALPETKEMIDSFILNTDYLPAFPVIMDRITKKVREILATKSDVKYSAEYLTINDEVLQRYIADLIKSKKEKSQHVELSLDIHHDIDDDEFSNNDMFKSLTPEANR